MKAVNAFKSHSITFRKAWLSAKEFDAEGLLLSKWTEMNPIMKASPSGPSY